jgi:IPT/TIG domain
MSDIRVFSRAFASRQRLAALALFVLAAVVSSSSPGRAQAPGSQKPVLGPGQTAHGAGRLVDPRKLPRASAKRTPFEEPDDAPPGYAEAKKLANAKTEPLPVKGPFSQPQVVSRTPRRPMKLSGAKPVSPATHGGIEHEGRGQAAPSKSAQAPPPIFGNAFLLDQEQFVGNSFCDVSSSCFSPPDTQVAAGFNEIVALSNNTMRVISKGGVVLQTNDLTPFFFAASDQTATDGKVVFDSGAGRYYMTDLLVNGLGNPTGSQVKLAVSQSSDPTGGWCIYSFGFFTRTDGTVLDQPKVGFSDDKIMISENENGGTPEDFDILQKSDVLAGCSGVAGTGFSNSDFNLMPVISLSFTSDMFAVYNFQSCFLFFCSQNAGILDITGTPAAGNVSIAETDKGINTLNTPPQGVQPAFPSGGTAPIDTSDNRYSTAVFQFGHIWAGADDACNPGDGNHACLRFDEFDATNGFNVLDDREIQSQGQDLYYPAISLDSSGNIFFVYTVSSSTMFPTVQTGASGLPFGGSFAAFNNFSGDSTYQCTFCKNKDGSLRPRWGDFSGAGQDPNNTSTIWLAGEFGANSSLAQGSDGWSTGIVALTFDIPFAVSVTPSSGPSSGGTFVDIHGGGFVNGGTSVFFGGVASPSVSFVSTDELFALTPAEAPGHTGVTPDTANGFGFDFTLGFDFHPSVTGVSPSSGPTSGGNSVNITGSGLTGATNVNFGGIGASFSVNNDGSITATAPAGAVGTVDVTVTTSGETSATSFADLYTYVVRPAVFGVSPNAGPSTGGTTVSISGSGFSTASQVTFGGVAAGFFINNDASITATAPAHAAGTFDVTVTSPGGTSATSAVDLYTYDARPTVTSVSPTAGPTTGGNTVTINGTNFLSSASVSFGGTGSASITFVSATRLKAVAPPHAAGMVDVTVTTPGGTSAASAADHYSYDARPTVSSLSPVAGSTTGGNTVTINGTNFLAGAGVKFGATASATVTFVSATQLKAVAPAHATGTIDLTVTTPGGTSAIVAGDHYTYDARPTVTSVSPTAGSTSGGNTVTINGTNFLAGAGVKFGATASATVTFVSATQLKAVAPAHAAGTVDVTVTTPGGTSALAAGDHYAYGPPTIASFSPASGITGGTVTINGTGFLPSATVKFGTKASATVTFVSGTQIKATVPNGAVTAKISVTTPAGTATSVSSFTVTLSVTGFSPASGPTGTVVTINGVGFNSSSAVKFNGVAASSVVHVSSTQMKATVPSTATTGPITVTNTAAPTGTVRSAVNYTKM